MRASAICPCGSQKGYAPCCGVYHNGVAAPSPTALMRSRYVAYALCLPTYIMQTTHPLCATYRADSQVWTAEIEQFSRATVFLELIVHASQQENDWGSVTFLARLLQNGVDVSFCEKSMFVRSAGLWLYRSGEFLRLPPGGSDGDVNVQ